MPRIPNSYPVTDLLAPYNFEDAFPILDYRFGLGGFRTVGVTTDLLIPSAAGEVTNSSTPDRSITSARRKKGMIAYVEGVTAFYGLFSSTADSAWEVVGPRYFKGGFRSLGTTTAMEAIAGDMREEGMVVYVSGRTAYYALIGTTANSGWTTGFTFGSGGGGGGIVGNYVATFNGLTGNVGGVCASSVNTFTALQTFNSGITTSFIYASTGSTFGGTIQVNQGATLAGRVDVGGILDVIGGITAESTLDVAGAARFNGNVTIGNASSDILTVTSGTTFQNSVDFSGAVRATTFTGNLGGTADNATTLASVAASSYARRDQSNTFVNASNIFRTTSANGAWLYPLTNLPAGTSVGTGLAFSVAGNAAFDGNVIIGPSGGQLEAGTTQGVVYIRSGTTFERAVDFAGAVRASTFTGNLSGNVTGNLTGTASNASALGNTAASGWAQLAASNTFTGSLNTFNNDVTIGKTLTVNGNFYVAGTVTTVNRTVLEVDDIQLRLGATTGTMTDALANDGGILLNGTTQKKFTWIDATDSWTSTEHMDLAAGKTYKIGTTTVLSSSTLGSGITTSSLQAVGTIISGTWNGSVVGLGYGGTNKDLSAASAGSVIWKDSDSFEATAVGTSGQLLQSNGSVAPTWIGPSSLTGLTATNINVTEDTSTNAIFYLGFFSGTGTRGAFIDTTGITFNPSTNILSCVRLEATIDGGTW